MEEDGGSSPFGGANITVVQRKNVGFLNLSPQVRLLPVVPNMITLKEHIVGHVKFLHYKEKELWYRCTNTEFVFPVPIEDCGTATFMAQDKAIFFIRYIRKHMETIKNPG